MKPTPIAEDTTVFGFWVYIMSDCVLFAGLFATYAVLHNNTFGAPSGTALFNLPSILKETLILLTSSFTCGLGMLAAHRNKKNQVLLWFGITLLLGLSFLGLEVKEFMHLVEVGDGWQRSASLSAYFTLVGTHGLHVALGSLWMFILMIQVALKGLKPSTTRRLMCLSLFWHFLDIIWIFIFTIVYLMGAL
jgi:cytochrome o ubiquinol oxidase subunit III